jgi:hypothetical protein
MRLLEFDNISIAESDIEALIKTNCSEALKICQTTHKAIYRGMGIYGGGPYEFISDTPKQRRKPTLNSDRFQAFIDDILYANGFKALRSNSIFCTSNREMASEYGNIYVIFPFDGFSMTGNKFHDDILPKRFFLRLLQLGYMSDENYPQILGHRSIRAETKTFIEAVNNIPKEKQIKVLGFYKDKLHMGLIVDMKLLYRENI